jgi:RNA polymerase sigma-70 factor (ECF subfamily)
MSKRGHRRTTAGEGNGVFRTTRWTEVFEAWSADEPRREVALAALLGRYWRPVFYYLRCKGYSRETAKDFTQGFFHEVVLGRSLIEAADRARGRFRTFLLTALDRYVANLRRAETRKRRVPSGGLISLEKVDWRGVPEPIHCTTPADAFDYAWASALLDQVLAQVKRECRETGKAVHWELFWAKVLQPIVDGVEAPSRAGLCEKHGVASTTKVSNMIVTVKRVFRTILRDHVRYFVEADTEVDDEINHLMKVFSRGGARS